MAIDAARPVEKRSKSKKIWWIIGSILLALILLAALAAFALRGGSSGGSDSAALSPSDLTKVEKKDFTTTLSGTGDISADREATLTTQLTGPVTSVEAAVGDRVAPQQVLAYIDTSKEEQELASQKASQNAELGESEEQFQQAQHELQELQNARAQAATEEEGVDLQNQVNAASRRVDRAWEQLTTARDSAQSQNNSLQVAINSGQVATPIGGVVTSADAHRGSPAEGPLFTVADDSSLKLTVMVKEADISTVKEGNRVTFTSPSAPGKEFEGTVSSISPVAGDSIPGHSTKGNMPGSDIESEEKAQFPVEIMVDGDHEGLRIGSTGKAKITTSEEKNATTIPLTAVTPDEDKTYVLAVTGEGDNARVEKREVTIGAKNNLDALVKDGLKPGDRIITQVKDHQDLDGQTVDLGEA